MFKNQSFTSMTKAVALAGVFFAGLTIIVGTIALFLSMVEPGRGVGLLAVALLGAGFGTLLLALVAGTLAEISQKIGVDVTNPRSGTVPGPVRKSTSFDKVMMGFDEPDG